MRVWRQLAASFVVVFAAAAAPAMAGGSGGVSPTTTTTTPTTTSTTPSNAAAQLVLGRRMLRAGMHGYDVMVLQRDLTAVGFAVPASGRFDSVTLRRLKAFQRRYRLVVDGIAGPSTIRTLKRLLNSKLHIAQSAKEAKDLATGTPVQAAVKPLPAGDSGLTGGVGLTGTTGTDTPIDTTEARATLIDGLAVPAPGTPQVIVDMIDAANRIAFDPYIYGGGHASFNSRGYDCSGSVSYVLHAGGLLASPLDSEQFLQYGLPGAGTWVTIYTNGPTHAYMRIAGLWFDTAAQTALNGNDRWSTTRIGEPGYGRFQARHPANL